MGAGASGRGEIGSTMRDAGLELAIKAAGGVGSLARGLGIAQPSVSAWSRIPAERVVAIEALTQVNRFVLRPDLYGSTEDQVTSKPEMTRRSLRAAEYGLLHCCWPALPPKRSSGATLKGDGSELGGAFEPAAPWTRPTDEREQGVLDLLIGLGPGECALGLYIDRLSNEIRWRGCARDCAGSGSSARDLRAGRSHRDSA